VLLIAQLSNQAALAAMLQPPGQGQRRSRRVVPTTRRLVVLTVDEIDRVIVKFDDGAAVQVLADEFGVHRNTIVRHLKRNDRWRRK